MVVFEFKSFCLARAEGNDAPNGIVRRDADGHAISRNHLDTEAAHPAAQLSEHFVSGITLHAVETAAVNRHDGALHVDEIVLTQTASVPFIVLNKHCATGKLLKSSYLGISEALYRRLDLPGEQFVIFAA